jgi:hypothetical protein
MFYVGFCPVCEGGAVGIRICGSVKHAIFLCDECDALWTKPDLEDDAAFPEQPHLPCPHCGTSLWEQPAHWASREDVATFGLQESVQGEFDEPADDVGAT